MYVCMHVCMCVCMYVCVYVCMYVCMYVFMYVCIYVYIYVCIYVCIKCMYIFIYACIYVCKLLLYSMPIINDFLIFVKSIYDYHHWIVRESLVWQHMQVFAYGQICSFELNITILYIFVKAGISGTPLRVLMHCWGHH